MSQILRHLCEPETNTARYKPDGCRLYRAVDKIGNEKNTIIRYRHEPLYVSLLSGSH